MGRDEECMLTTSGFGFAHGGAGREKMVIVRPHVVVDPEWDDIVAEAKRTSRTGRAAEKDRRKRDADIVGADEREIPTEDKVVLLVSRSLNDRTSLPGHVYRCLVREYRTRAARRKEEEEAGGAEGRDGSSGANGEGRVCCAIPRMQCRDAHGVIKHVTETLLEVRPGFGSSLRLAAKTAAAVEALVFGELYDEVFGEIVEETRSNDEALMRKIGVFEMGRLRQRHVALAGRQDESEDCRRKIRGEDISVGALEALLRMPEARSPVDKLDYCVSFIESISAHFSGNSERHDRAVRLKGSKEDKLAVHSMGADSLLRMVCEHIIVAKVPHLHAELTFLEEFARDERLLRGKEGYSLVTLRSSLHILDSSEDIYHDIIRHDE